MFGLFEGEERKHKLESAASCFSVINVSRFLRRPLASLARIFDGLVVEELLLRSP